MDILIIISIIAFIGLITTAGSLFLPKESTKSKAPALTKEKPKIKKSEIEIIAHYNKKVALYEEKTRSMELSAEALRLEIAQLKDKEKEIVKEKSKIIFDSEQSEKLKKNYLSLKEEAKDKEEQLEKEILSKKQVSTELFHIKIEHDTLKNKFKESENMLRKIENIAENLTKELTSTKKTIAEQKKIVNEHRENKAEGEWVSRSEFNKIEQELKEKGILVQKLLAIKKDAL